MAAGAITIDIRVIGYRPALAQVQIELSLSGNVISTEWVGAPTWNALAGTWDDPRIGDAIERQVG